MARENKKLIQVYIPEKLLQRFSEIMPMHGAISWFVRESMERFVMDMMDEPADAIERVQAGLRGDLTKADGPSTFMPTKRIRASEES